MTSSERRRGPAAAPAIGLALVALSVAIASIAYWAEHVPGTSRTAGLTTSPSPSSAGPASPSPSSALPRDTILAWTPGGLPPGFAAAVRNVPGVAHVVVVGGGTAWLARTRSASGERLTSPPPGMLVPIEVASADPAALAPLWPAALRPALAALGRGQAVLGATSARIRRMGPGGELVFSRASIRMPPLRVRVGAIVSDASVGAAEVLISARVARHMGPARPRYLLVAPSGGASRARVETGIRHTVPAGTKLRMRARGQTPFLRQGDAVLAPVMVKRLFGEFAANPAANAGGWFTMDPRWARRNIVTAGVPVLGRVTCNRRIIPQLRAALEEVVARGLAGLIDSGDYGGCYTPRLLNAADPGAGPGHHAWGIAIDINVSKNPFGGRPTQDPRIVAIFRRWGFTWGGRWLVPDGMHFEATRIVTP